MSANLRSRIAGHLEQAVRGLGVKEVPDLELGRARNRDHGDYASSAGLKLARVLRRPPSDIAGELAGSLSMPEAQAEAVGGYVNFRLRPEYLRQLVREVAATGPAYGSSELGAGARIQVEFVSVNPTGPLTVGHGRGAILGDSLCRLLSFTGHRVQREYYVNDQNTQARLFGQSILARMRGEEPPERGYQGEYVNVIAEAARAALPGVLEAPAEEAESSVRAFGIARMIDELRVSLTALGVDFDEWFHESRLWEQGLPQRAIERLREGRHLVEREGALWFAPELETGAPGDEDRVVVRANGEPTYFASDLGYLLSKFEDRGFDTVIDIWGADHHGYVPRMKAACEALGISRERLVVILNQIVTLRGERISKRAGRFVLLDELRELVGTDAVRFFFLLRSPDAMMDFDLDLAVAHGRENPVYYAQYAHARLVNAEARARELDLPAEADLQLLGEQWELDLVREIARWPEAVEDAAMAMEPHRIPYYVHELADRVHAFYDMGNRDARRRVVVDADPALTAARVELCRAARATLRSAFDLIGVSAPDRM